MLVHLDSRAVVMEVEIRQEVCNNLPAECTSPENGFRLSGGGCFGSVGGGGQRVRTRLLLREPPTCRKERGMEREKTRTRETPCAPHTSADLGASSNHSSGILED